jgi:hypothetical protein
MPDDTLTRRQEIVLAALSTDSSASFAPVQVQKLFFLIDENIDRHLGGKLFRFQPYNYGPFDADVYRELETLSGRGLVSITQGPGGRRHYRLTPSGFAAGQNHHRRLAPDVRTYLEQASAWVRSLPFASLVGSIYRAYPHMRQNSIFAG